MTIISYRGRTAALAGSECFYLAPHIAERPDGDPVKRFVCFLALYARDVLTGELPDEPRRYLPACAERYARECLIAPRAFLALVGLPDAELAEHFGVPLEQIPKRRAELVPRPPRRPARARRRPGARCRPTAAAAERRRDGSSAYGSRRTPAADEGTRDA